MDLELDTKNFDRIDRFMTRAGAGRSLSVSNAPDLNGGFMAAVGLASNQDNAPVATFALSR